MTFSVHCEPDRHNKKPFAFCTPVRVKEPPAPAENIDFKIMFLDCVIGRLRIPIRLPPSILAKNII